MKSSPHSRAIKRWILTGFVVFSPALMATEAIPDEEVSQGAGGDGTFHWAAFGAERDYWDTFTWRDQDVYQESVGETGDTSPSGTEPYNPYDPVYVVTFEPVAGLRANDAAAHGASDDKMVRSSGKIHVLGGEVQALSHATLTDGDGRPRLFTLAKVKLEDGETVVMSLGEAEMVAGLELKKGDRIQTAGATGRIARQPVIVVRALRADGALLRVNRQVPRSLADGNPATDDAGALEAERGENDGAEFSPFNRQGHLPARQSGADRQAAPDTGESKKEE